MSEIPSVDDRLTTDDVPPPSPSPSPSFAPGFIPWGSAEILLLLLTTILIHSAVQAVLVRSDFFTWFYGSEINFAELEASRSLQQRAGLWVACLSAPLQIAAVLLLLYQLHEVSPKELGLTTERFGRQVVAGLLFAGIFAPGAYAINWLMTVLLTALGSPLQEHPFTELSQGRLMPMEWGLLVFAAVIVAPIWEELFYRGLVQPWILSRQPWGGAVALGLSLVLTIGYREQAFRVALGEGPAAVKAEVLPFLILLFLGGIYIVLIRLNPRSQAAGLFASSVLFAWVHMSVWPSPVALLWLALGLSWLAWRSRSLVGAMALHAVFNAIACLTLLWQ